MVVRRWGGTLAQGGGGVLAVAVDDLLVGGQRVGGPAQLLESDTFSAQRRGDLLAQGRGGVLAVGVDDLLEGGQRVGGPAQLAGRSSGKVTRPRTPAPLASQLAGGAGSNFQTPQTIKKIAAAVGGP